VPKPFLTSLSIGIPWIKLHTNFKVWSLSSLQLVSKMIENIWQNFTPTSETVNKDNNDQVFSRIFKYYKKSPKKRVIRVCLNWIESMSLLWLSSNSLVLGFPNCILLGLRLGFQFVDCWVGVGFLVCKLLGCGWVSNFQVYRLLGFPMFRLLHILGFQFANYWAWGWVF
jgi:hypothetical protein